MSISHHNAISLVYAKTFRVEFYQYKHLTIFQTNIFHENKKSQVHKYDIYKNKNDPPNKIKIFPSDVVYLLPIPNLTDEEVIIRKIENVTFQGPLALLCIAHI